VPNVCVFSRAINLISVAIYSSSSVVVCSFPVAVDNVGLGAFAASELDKVFSGYQPR
jgi:hypothetical protein